MKKSIKLITSCLLLCICCFDVVGCGSNTIKLKVDETLEKRSISNYTFDINSSTVTIPKDKQDGWTIDNYCGLSKTIKEEIGEDVSVKVELKDGDETIIIINGSIQ